MTVKWAMWLMLAKASPRKPYVLMEERSSNVLSLDVVNLSHRIGKSSFCWDGQHVQGMAMRETCIDSAAIVCDLEQFEAAIFNQDFH